MIEIEFMVSQALDKMGKYRYVHLNYKDLCRCNSTAYLAIFIRSNDDQYVNTNRILNDALNATQR